jgi:hypothetical protein
VGEPEARSFTAYNAARKAEFVRGLRILRARFKAE